MKARPATRRSRPAAFTLLEAAFSTVLVGGLVVVSLETLGSTTIAKQATNDAAAARMLAASLMAEVLRLEYEDPSEVATFGLETSENALSRLGFDDVDDYRDWSLSPPKYRDGTAIPGYSGWTCAVDVVRVNPSDLTQESVSDTGVKRIDVSVTRNGVEIARLSALKTGSAAGAPLANVPITTKLLTLLGL